MRLGIIGLPQSGKSTIFSALLGARGSDELSGGAKSGAQVATVIVYDERIDFLKEIDKPKKVTYVRIEYVLPSDIPPGAAAKSEAGLWGQVRICDALIHVVRNFQSLGGEKPNPEKDFWRLEEELILNDLMVAEKRLERLKLDLKRGRKEVAQEISLLESCKDLLDRGIPLRVNEDLANNPALRGFTFLSAKPVLVVLNNEDEDESLPPWSKKPEKAEQMLIRGKLEADIAAMDSEEAKEFLEAYHVEDLAVDRIIKASFRLLNRISFFTAGPDELRAWAVPDGITALDAAGTVHTDMKRGFIRAEVVAFDDLKKYGSFQAAKKAGALRLEGKEYLVKDGDIIHFRFNV